MPSPAEAVPAANRAHGSAHHHQLFVDGSWVSPRLGGQIEVISAYSEDVLATVAEGSAADVDSAVAAARRAFDTGPWAHLEPAERAGYLRKLARKLESRIPELAQAWVDQVGALKSVAPFVIGAGNFWFDYYAGLVETYPFAERRKAFDGHGEAWVVREPAGVVAAIAPWNNPFGIMTGKLAPALLAGCTVIMKPAPETPLEAYILAEAAQEVGFPPGVINLLTTHRDAADHLASHPGVDKVTFTGSVAAGRRIATVCGDRLARYTLELGGKSAAIILDDYDVAAAAKVLAATISMSAGQVCATLSRVVVSERRHDALIECLTAELAAIRVGDPNDPDTQMGPLAMERQRARVESYIGIGKSEGAALVAGGKRPASQSKGFFVEPTLFTHVKSNMRIAREEIFGPVLSVLTYTSVEDAVQIANDSPFGLYGAVFTNDLAAAYRTARRLRAGTVSHNIFRFDPSVPFGGFKHSGVGREGGTEGLSSFTELKSILLDGTLEV